MAQTIVGREPEVMTEVLSFEHLPNGLPDTLLTEDGNGTPRVFHLFPHPDRSYRRWIAKLIRQNSKYDGTDSEVLVRFLSSRTGRQHQFWLAAERMERGTFKADSFPFSLDLILLQKADDGDAPPEFDEVRFSAACAEWPVLKANIERLAKRSFESVPAHGQRFLMLWLNIREQIRKWKDDERKDWPTLEAIFSLSSITDSPWFINQAMVLAPDISRRLRKLFQDKGKDIQVAKPECEQDDCPNGGVPGGTLETPATSADGYTDLEVESEWSALAVRITDVGNWLGKDPPNVWSERRGEIIEILESTLAAIKKYDPQDVARALLQKRINKFATRLTSFDSQAALESVIGVLRIRLTEWKSRAEDLPTDEIVRLGNAIGDALGQLGGQLVALRDAHAAHVEIRQKYLLAQKEAEEGPSIVTRRAAASLRAEDSKAESRLLDAHDSLLLLLNFPVAATSNGAAKAAAPNASGESEAGLLPGSASTASTELPTASVGEVRSILNNVRETAISVASAERIGEPSSEQSPLTELKKKRRPSPPSIVAGATSQTKSILSFTPIRRAEIVEPNVVATESQTGGHRFPNKSQ